jgi:hypothetical protein
VLQEAKEASISSLQQLLSAKQRALQVSIRDGRHEQLRNLQESA